MSSPTPVPNVGNQSSTEMSDAKRASMLQSDALGENSLSALEDITKNVAMSGNLDTTTRLINAAGNTAFSSAIAAADTKGAVAKDLDSAQNYYQDNLNVSTGILRDQTNALGVVQEEVKRAQNRVDLINQQKNSRQRLVEINRYYGQKYRHHTNILKYITVIFAVLLVITYIYNQGLIPPFLYTFMFTAVGVYGGYNIIKELYDAYTRHNMIYAQYDWNRLRGKPDPIDMKKVGGDSRKVSSKLSLSGGITCVGQSCCPENFTYVIHPFNQCFSNANLKDKDFPKWQSINSYFSKIDGETDQTAEGAKQYLDKDGHYKAYSGPANISIGGATTSAEVMGALGM